MLKNLNKIGMKRIFSGIQPSGNLHIGNYLGAVSRWPGLQNEYDCIYCVVDLHALTIYQKPEILREKILETATILLASGIDSEKGIVFIQSQVKEHAELAWILNTGTRVGELAMMTQFKEKTRGIPKDFEKFAQEKFIKEFGRKPESDIEKVTVGVVSENLKEFQDLIGNMFQANIGLLDYPVLMAADILLYQTEAVPVGEDQKQHIEFSRTIARKFNNLYGATFKEPQEIIKKESARIMSLANPEVKMSKSDKDPNGCLGLLDSADEIRGKIKSAVTDSDKKIIFDAKNKKGIANLLTIYSLFSEKSIKDLEKEYSGKNYAEFKNDLAEIVIGSLAGFQKKFKELKKDQNYVKKILEDGAEKAKEIARETMAEVKKKIGLMQS